jgi:hypothetical protein
VTGLIVLIVRGRRRIVRHLPALAFAILAATLAPGPLHERQYDEPEDGPGMLTDDLRNDFRTDGRGPLRVRPSPRKT